MAIEMLIVLAAALVISLISAVLHKIFVNQNDLKQLKNDVKYQKQRGDEARKRGDKDTESAASKDLMALSGKQMKLTMKPLMYSMIFVIVILGFLSTNYTELIIKLPILMPGLSWTFPFIIFISEYNWFFWYIIVSVPSTFFFRKMLGVE
ncbi:MAG: EMC3/TMCO1 family protein [Nanoarchaeota archaeon]